MPPSCERAFAEWQHVRVLTGGDVRPADIAAHLDGLGLTGPERSWTYRLIVVLESELRAARNTADGAT